MVGRWNVLFKWSLFQGTCYFSVDNNKETPPPPRLDSPHSPRHRQPLFHFQAWACIRAEPWLGIGTGHKGVAVNPYFNDYLQYLYLQTHQNYVYVIWFICLYNDFSCLRVQGYEADENVWQVVWIVDGDLWSGKWRWVYPRWMVDIISSSWVWWCRISICMGGIAVMPRWLEKT